MNIKKRKGLFYWISKKFGEWRNSFLRFLLNYRRKRDRLSTRQHFTHESSPDLKTISTKRVTDADLKQMGRRRDFKRVEDNSNTRINAIKNKKTGVVVMTSGNANDIKERYGDDYEVVESKIKE